MHIHRILFLGLGPQREFDEELVGDNLLSFINPKHLTDEGELRDSFLDCISIFTSTTSFLLTILGLFSKVAVFIFVLMSVP